MLWRWQYWIVGGGVGGGGGVVGWVGCPWLGVGCWCWVLGVLGVYFFVACFWLLLFGCGVGYE